MAEIFFPSCKVKLAYPEASEKLGDYIKEKFNAEITGCCRANHTNLTPNDTALVVCNNCAAILEESSESKNIKFIYELIDKDETFEFPDYHGETMAIQDCWIAFEKKHLQNTIRSLLAKMNINYVELEENFEKTRFCGTNLLSTCNPSNAKLAPKRYVENGAHMFRPCSPEEQVLHFQDHCKKIKEDKVICYCKFCTDAINMGGKEGIYIIELLFPKDK